MQRREWNRPCKEWLMKKKEWRTLRSQTHHGRCFFLSLQFSLSPTLFAAFMQRSVNCFIICFLVRIAGVATIELNARGVCTNHLWVKLNRAITLKCCRCQRKRTQNDGSAKWTRERLAKCMRSWLQFLFHLRHRWPGTSGAQPESSINGLNGTSLCPSAYLCVWGTLDADRPKTEKNGGDDDDNQSKVISRSKR